MRGVLLAYNIAAPAYIQQETARPSFAAASRAQLRFQRRLAREQGGGANAPAIFSSVLRPSWHVLLHTRRDCVFSAPPLTTNLRVLWQSSKKPALESAVPPTTYGAGSLEHITHLASPRSGAAAPKARRRGTMRPSCFLRPRLMES